VRGGLVGYVVCREVALLVAYVLLLRCSEIGGSGYQEKKVCSSKPIFVPSFSQCDMSLRSGPIDALTLSLLILSSHSLH
jgi:hypothetical protein